MNKPLNNLVYPIWWENTITLYNRYQDPVTDLITWTPTVIHDCFVKRANNRIIIGGTSIETGDKLVRIRESEDYVTYSKWIELPNDIRAKKFTLHLGDLIIFYEVSDVIDEYSKGHRASDILAKYKDMNECMVISNYQENIGSGRVDPHYYVLGG